MNQSWNPDTVYYRIGRARDELLCVDPIVFLWHGAAGFTTAAPGPVFKLLHTDQEVRFPHNVNALRFIVDSDGLAKVATTHISAESTRASAILANEIWDSWCDTPATGTNRDMLDDVNPLGEGFDPQFRDLYSLFADDTDIHRALQGRSALCQSIDQFDLELLSRNHVLKHVSITSVTVDDWGVLGELHGLRSLCINDVFLSESFANALQRLMRLEYLSLTACRISAHVAGAIEARTSLTTLVLTGTGGVNDESFARTAAALPCVTSLDLAGTDVGEQTFKALSANCRELRRLDITGTVACDSSCDDLLSLPKLREVEIRNTNTSIDWVCQKHFGQKECRLFA